MKTNKLKDTVQKHWSLTKMLYWIDSTSIKKSTNIISIIFSCCYFDLPSNVQFIWISGQNCFIVTITIAISLNYSNFLQKKRRKTKFNFPNKKKDIKNCPLLLYGSPFSLVAPIHFVYIYKQTDGADSISIYSTSVWECVCLCLFFCCLFLLKQTNPII